MQGGCVTQNERLRALLRDAHDGLWPREDDSESMERQLEAMRDRIDAALAEPSETEETEHAMHMRIRAGYDRVIADSWRAKVAEVERERDEARAEVERLRKLIDQCEEAFEAIRRANHERGHAAADEMLAIIEASK